MQQTPRSLCDALSKSANDAFVSIGVSPYGVVVPRVMADKISVRCLQLFV